MFLPNLLSSHSPTIIVEANEFMNATCTNSSSDKLVPLKESDKLLPIHSYKWIIYPRAHTNSKNVRKCFTSHILIWNNIISKQYCYTTTSIPTDDGDAGKGNVLKFQLQTLSCLFSFFFFLLRQKNLWFFLEIVRKPYFGCVSKQEQDRIKQIQYL